MGLFAAAALWLMASFVLAAVKAVDQTRSDMGEVEPGRDQEAVADLAHTKVCELEAAERDWEEAPAEAAEAPE